MLLRINRDRKNRVLLASPARERRKVLRLFAMGSFMVFAALTVSYEASPQQRNGNAPILLPAVNRPPDANDQMAMREAQTKKANLEAANVERKRQIGDDSAKLLKLATDLKAEVDKTSKDTLSLGVIRKAEEIEKLAHNVKEKMKLTMASN